MAQIDCYTNWISDCGTKRYTIIGVNLNWEEKPFPKTIMSYSVMNFETGKTFEVEPQQFIHWIDKGTVVFVSKCERRG